MSTAGRGSQSGKGNHVRSPYQGSRAGGAEAGGTTFNDYHMPPSDPREPTVGLLAQSFSAFPLHAAASSVQYFPHTPGAGVTPPSLFLTNGVQSQGYPMAPPSLGAESGWQRCMNSRCCDNAFHDTSSASINGDAKECHPRQDGGDRAPRQSGRHHKSGLPTHPPQQQMPAPLAYGVYMPGSVGFGGNGGLQAGMGRAAGAPFPYAAIPVADAGGGASGRINDSDYVMVRSEFMQMVLQQGQTAQAFPLAASGSDRSSLWQQQQLQQQTASYATGTNGAVVAGPRFNGYPNYAMSGPGNVYSSSSSNSSAMALSLAPQQQLSIPCSQPLLYPQSQQQGDLRLGSLLKDGISMGGSSIAPAAAAAKAATSSSRMEALSTPGAYILHPKNTKSGRRGTDSAHRAQSSGVAEALNANTSAASPLYSHVLPHPAEVLPSTAAICGCVFGGLSDNTASSLNPQPHPCAAPPPPVLSLSGSISSGVNSSASPPPLPSGSGSTPEGVPSGVLLPPPPPASLVKGAPGSAHHRGDRGGGSAGAGYSTPGNSAGAGAKGGGRHSRRGGAGQLEQQQQHQGGGGDAKASVEASGDAHRRSSASHTRHRSGSNDGPVEPRNGASYAVGGWYEGVVKRYNPLRGFGFLTCTYQLRFDLRACEKACARNAEDVYAKQQQQDLEKAVVAATSFSDGSQDGGSGGAAHDEGDEGFLRPLSTTCADSKCTPAAQLRASLKEKATSASHCAAAANAHREASALHEGSTTEVDAEKPNEGAGSAAMTEATSNRKTHGTVVYSTMQWYLHMADEKRRRMDRGSSSSHKAAEDTSTDAAATAAAEDSRERESGGDDRSDAVAHDTLVREPAQMGDIFVHHSCISMGGFRVFVPGTVVRFSVAVLMDTVQAVDVVPLGPEWERPLTPEEMVNPPLYRVTPTAATILRYRNLADAEEQGDSPHSRVGSTSVQWRDMAVIPSAAIPNSVEGLSELQIVRVPAAGPMIPKTSADASKRFTVAALATEALSAVADGAAPLTPRAAAEEGKRDGGEGEAAVSATPPATTDVGTSAKAAKTPLAPALHPDDTPTTFGAVDGDHQQAPQGLQDAPALSPTSYSTFKDRCASNVELADAAEERAPREGEAGDHAAACAVLEERGSPADFSGVFRAATAAQAFGGGPRDTTTGAMMRPAEEWCNPDGLLAAATEATNRVNDSGEGHHADGHCHHHEQKELANSNTNCAPMPLGPAGSGLPNLCTPAGVDDGEHMDAIGSSGGNLGDEDAVKMMSTPHRGSGIPDSTLKSVPDWTMVFDHKIARERAKDALMHKAVLKFFPYCSAKSAAAAATSQRRGGAAAVENLQPVAALDSRFSLGAEAGEKAMGASESCSEGHSASNADWGSCEVKPPSSKRLTPASQSEPTSVPRTTPEECSENEVHHGPKTTSEEMAEGEKRRCKSEKGCFPALVMVLVEDLPLSLASKVPHGVSVIALPKATVKELKIKSSPLDAANVALLSSPAGTDSLLSLPSSHRQLPRSSSEPSLWPVAPASPQSTAISSDGEYYRNLVLAAGNMTMSSESSAPHSPRKQRNANSPVSTSIEAPCVTTPAAHAVAAAAPAMEPLGEQRSSQPLTTSAEPSSVVNAAHTSLGSSHVPVPQCVVEMPLPPWMRSTEPSHQPTPNRNSASYVSSPQRPHTEPLPLPRTPMRAKDVMMPFHDSTVQPGLNRQASGIPPQVMPMTCFYTQPSMSVLAPMMGGSGRSLEPYPYTPQAASTRATPVGSSFFMKPPAQWSSPKGGTKTKP
ncbi:hypothetical protein ABL78_3671 [Leptomonas seymouri]|uniref:CSD domain-containing protein n=1 Tax=Leptomonas seymouri TaxID=5684 RepID=A0A0N1I4G6_LEPSE|nr:hypothetical protein ABL78_3671 [Leptomonas seymouri]|eukprot:KPI87234.1 hypothetical protein ABL78_3671 [Leptomonas seymouri]